MLEIINRVKEMKRAFDVLICMLNTVMEDSLNLKIGQLKLFRQKYKQKNE